MPRFFFELDDNFQAPDEQGRVLDTLETAKRFAVREVRALITADTLEDGIVDLRHRLIVRDESGAVIYTVQFADVITVLHPA